MPAALGQGIRELGFGSQARTVTARFAMLANGSISDMTKFMRWLGTVEGRFLRNTLIVLALLGLMATAMEMSPGKQGHAFDGGWVIVRPCGPIMCPSGLTGAEHHKCGEYLLKRDTEGRYWRTNQTFRDQVDKDSIDIVCPLPKP